MTCCSHSTGHSKGLSDEVLLWPTTTPCTHSHTREQLPGAAGLLTTSFIWYSDCGQNQLLPLFRCRTCLKMCSLITDVTWCNWSFIGSHSTKSSLMLLLHGLWQWCVAYVCGGLNILSATKGYLRVRVACTFLLTLCEKGIVPPLFLPLKSMMYTVRWAPLSLSSAAWCH